MVSRKLQTVPVRQDARRDHLIELAVALPPDRPAGVVTAIGNGLATSPRHHVWT
jgi:hypothetical protein